jgi:hypothetical protein
VQQALLTYAYQLGQFGDLIAEKGIKNEVHKTTNYYFAVIFGTSHSNLGTMFVDNQKW